MDPPIEAVIGVDVGGTNTDAVILQIDCRPPRVLSSAKSVTTRDVTSGIKSAISVCLNKRNKEQTFSLQRVNIGTTHFLNAVVQRKELAKVAVIRLCGTASRQVPPFTDFPADLATYVNGGVYFVNGGYEVDGREISCVDKQEILNVANESHRKGVIQFVICGIHCSIRNDQELLVKSIIQSAFPESSVTLSHVIGQIGLLERENAAILNECLKPLCRRTITGFKNALLSLNLTCPLYLTQNDGTVINEQDALEHPVCTFASGPTNSMRGAAFLSGISDAIVVDIGGTTTDVGILRKGFPREASTEIKMGEVRTNFRMPDVYSIGLGGGSYVTSHRTETEEFSVTVGPRSAGYNITNEAFIFQKDTESCQLDNLTATDLAVAAGHVTIGNKNNVLQLEPQLVQKGIEKIKSMVENAIDRVKLSAEPLPVILVGGGGIILNVQNGLAGASELLFPKHFEVANAVGAALSQVSGTIETIVNLAEDVKEEQITKMAASICSRELKASEDFEVTKKNIRKNIYEKTRQAAVERAIESVIDITVHGGADRETVTLLDKSDISLAYLPGNSTKITCKAVGTIKSSNEYAQVIGRDFTIPTIEDQQTSMETVVERIENLEPADYNNYQPTPFINETKEWILSEYDIDCIAIGAGILGCGGGGSPHLGNLLAKRALREGKIMKVVNPVTFLQKSDPNNDLVAVMAYMGAPVVITEKLVNYETVAALKCMKDLYATVDRESNEYRLANDLDIQTEDGVTFINDYTTVTRVSNSIEIRSNVVTKKRIVALMSGEIGGMNALEPLIVGAELGMPILDCDGMGRAFPELQMFCPLIYGTNPCPSALADNKGRCAVALRAETPKQLENYFRKVVIDMGCQGGVVLTSLNKGEVLHRTVLFSISRAWRIGNSVLLARKQKNDPIQAVLEDEGGTRLIAGKITDVRRETTGGFNRGFIDITGVESFSEQRLLVEFQNENLIARKYTTGNSGKGNILACTPDLITIVDDDTCEPITTEMVRYGMRVSVLVLPIPDIMKTSDALKVVGPQAFGYSNDVGYIAVGICKDPVPIVT